jgi:hypothetical protein
MPRELRWTCPACGGEVRAGSTEREPVRCGGCGAGYRHPRLALLLSLALPGLGSIVQGRRIWGLAVLAFGTGAFLGALWRLVVHLRVALGGAEPDLVRLLADAGIGIALVVAAYLADLLVVWLRRDRLAPIRGEP